MCYVLCVCVLFCVAYLVVACYYIPGAVAPPIWEKRLFPTGIPRWRQRKTTKKKTEEKFVRLVVAFDSGHSDPPPGRRYVKSKMFGFLASETIHGFSLDHHRSVNYTVYTKTSRPAAGYDVVVCLFSSSRVNSNET